MSMDVQTVLLFALGGFILVAVVGILSGLGTSRAIVNAIRATRGDVRFLDTAEAKFLALPENVQALARALLSIADNVDLPGEIDDELRKLGHDLTDGLPNVPPETPPTADAPQS